MYVFWISLKTGCQIWQRQGGYKQIYGLHIITTSVSSTSTTTAAACERQRTFLWQVSGPRFDDGASDLLAVDFSTFLAREAKLLAEVARAVGNLTEAIYWGEIAANVSRYVHAVFWDEKAGLYFDVHASTGNHSTVAASTALLPLWLDDIPPERVPRLLGAMRDPTLFGTPLPLPLA